MNCGEVQNRLIDNWYGELADNEVTQVRGHLEECEACRKEASLLHALSSALDRWEIPATPPRLAEQVIARLGQEAEATARRAFATRAVLPFLFGAGAAALALLLLAGPATEHGITTPLAFGLLGALWTVLFGGSFLVAFEVTSQVKLLARTALLAAGLTLLFTPVLSIPTVVEACQSWLGGAKGSIPLNLLLFLTGSLYTAVPVFLASFALGRDGEGPPARPGFGSGLLYLLLIAPAIALECASLTLGIMATWLAGALAGAVAGGPAGLWLVRQRTLAAG